MLFIIEIKEFFCNSAFTQDIARRAYEDEPTDAGKGYPVQRSHYLSEAAVARTHIHADADADADGDGDGEYSNISTGYYEFHFNHSYIPHTEK